MANPNFMPEYSTNQIYVGDNDNICLTDTLEEMQTDIGEKAAQTHTHTEYAPVAHEHSGYANSNHTHTEYAPTSHEHSGYAASEHTHTGFAAENHTHDYANATHTHAQSDITGLSEALEGKSDTSHTHTGFAADTHNHDSDYIDKSLQFTADNGNILHSFVATDDVLTKMAELACGVHTCYCPVASVNAPKQTEAWRFLVHKTGTSKNYGWVMAFGSRGSVYSNYIDAGNWRGWKCIHDIEPEPLWTGAMYMTSGHTVEPTKTLSDCRNGWLLLWSDYDPAEGENNYDFSTTMIPKRAYTGQKWGGGQFLCMVPCHFAADGHNHITKCLHIYDAKIVGHENNSVVDRNDVVLRAVYEF